MRPDVKLNNQPQTSNLFRHCAAATCEPASLQRCCSAAVMRPVAETHQYTILNLVCYSCLTHTHCESH